MLQHRDPLYNSQLWTPSQYWTGGGLWGPWISKIYGFHRGFEPYGCKAPPPRSKAILQFCNRRLCDLTEFVIWNMKCLKHHWGFNRNSGLRFTYGNDPEIFSISIMEKVPENRNSGTIGTIITLKSYICKYNTS